MFTSVRFIRYVDHETILDGIINFWLIAITIGIFFWAYKNDKKLYRQNKKRIEYISTCLAILIVIAFSTKLFLLNLRDRSPSIIICESKEKDFNGVSIDFRKDGTFKLMSWSLNADYYRGSYTMADSIIVIKDDGGENVLQSNRLLIKSDGEKDSLGNIDRSIYQINEDGHIMEGTTAFRVIPKPE